MAETRENNGYKIIMAEQYDQEYDRNGKIVQTAEIVLGHDKKRKCSPWVVWHCFNKTDYSWGHYFQNGDDALIYWHETLATEYSLLCGKHQCKAETLGYNLKGDHTNG